MKKIFEKIVEGILACSGFVTSLTIVLIVVFLFSEALGLFSSKVIEEGYVLALNKENRVGELTPAQIKNVFDEELTNWNEVGGEDLPIRLFRLEDITLYYTEEQLGASYENAGACITELVERTPGIIAFVPQQFIVRPDSVHLLKDNTISVKDVFAGAEWFPTATPAAQFGFLPLITGTLWVSLFAILFALPFGLSVAIYMSEVANSRVRNLLKPIIELLSGIPSVVYGFFGLIVIVPFLQQVFDLPVGESGLAGSIVLAIMALPTIITVTEDAMRNCPRAMREASLALGASQWQTIYKVVIPYSISGITSGVVLGIGRAVGETMAVLMVTGNAAVIPHTILEPLRTILFALPFGLSVAIYMSEVANSRVRNLLKPIIELLSGIPSVVYGFFGLIVIVPFLQQVFDLPVGESGLAGSIVLAIMALPTIITVTEDAMRNCPRAMREASLALGASQWQTIYKVVIPYSISGITSGVVLGIGRAVGETMAVLMVTGNAAVIPHTILEPLRTIPATIAAELGEAPAGGPHYEALFLLGVVLFFISLLINFTVEAVSPRRK